jgi:hypothetical protein
MGTAERLTGFADARRAGGVCSRCSEFARTASPPIRRKSGEFALRSRWERGKAARPFFSLPFGREGPKRCLLASLGK